MQLRETKFIGAFDQNCIGAGNIDTRFDNCGADQNIKALVVKVGHHLFQLLFAHLPVGNLNACLGNQPLQFIGCALD